MKTTELQKMLSGSVESETGDTDLTLKLQETLAYDFREGFEDKVLGRILSEGASPNIEDERNFNLVFYRVAFSAAAAAAILVLSIFLTEGSLSVDSLLGLGDGYSESIVCLLTGN